MFGGAGGKTEREPARYFSLIMVIPGFLVVLSQLNTICGFKDRKLNAVK